MSKPALSTRRCRRTRRGSVYLLALGMGTMLTVVGLAVAMTGRINTRNAAADRNLSAASSLAASAVDLAVATVNSDGNWRKSRGSNTWNPNVPLGSGGLAWKQVDEIDNDVANNPDQPVRLVGMATVGSAARQFSILAAPAGTSALPVLASTLHSETSIIVGAATTSSGGPITTDGALTNTSSITGNVEAVTVTNSGSIVGFVGTPARDRRVPDAAAVAEYGLQATQIPFANLSNGGDIDSTILSSTSNPYGASDADGVYLIRVPSGRRLRIRDSIIQATLLVELQGTSELEVRNLVAWEPPSIGRPALIATGSSSCTVTIAQTRGTVNVPLLGVNLLGIVIVIGTRATAPSELHGLFHVMGGAQTSFQQAPRLVGTWIGDGPIGITGTLQMIAEPNLVTDPPPGYTRIDSRVTAVPGSFRWEER